MSGKIATNRHGDAPNIRHITLDVYTARMRLSFRMFDVDSRTDGPLPTVAEPSWEEQAAEEAKAQQEQQASVRHCNVMNLRHQRFENSCRQKNQQRKLWLDQTKSVA